MELLYFVFAGIMLGVSKGMYDVYREYLQDSWADIACTLGVERRKQKVAAYNKINNTAHMLGAINSGVAMFLIGAISFLSRSIHVEGNIALVIIAYLTLIMWFVYAVAHNITINIIKGRKDHRKWYYLSNRGFDENLKEFAGDNDLVGHLVLIFIPVVLSVFYFFIF